MTDTCVEPIGMLFGLDGHTWCFIHDQSGYYGLDSFGNRREFNSRDELRHICEYYQNIGWTNLGVIHPGNYGEYF